MAYMNQEKKAKIAAALAAAVPAGWKYRLRVQNHLAIVMTIDAAPVDLLAGYRGTDSDNSDTGRETPQPVTRATVNHRHLERRFSGDALLQMQKVAAALDTGNHDRSDITTDLHDVGHYVDLYIGSHDRPFVCTSTAEVPENDHFTGLKPEEHPSIRMRG